MSTRSPLFLRSPWTTLVQAASHLLGVWQRRRMVGHLGALDDRLLADMGITRQDVLSVLAESMFVDPSQKLAERAHASRRARKASVLDALSYERSGPVRDDRRAA